MGGWATNRPMQQQQRPSEVRIPSPDPGLEDIRFLFEKTHPPTSGQTPQGATVLIHPSEPRPPTFLPPVEFDLLRHLMEPPYDDDEEDESGIGEEEDWDEDSWPSD